MRKRPGSRLGRAQQRPALPTRFAHLKRLEVLDDGLELGIASPEFPREPVSASLGNSLAVGDHLELTCPARPHDGVNVEVLLDQGHETRGLGFVTLSYRAVDDLNLHFVLLLHGRPSYSASVATLCGPFFEQNA